MNSAEFRSRIIEHLNENNARKAIEELLEVSNNEELHETIIKISENIEALVFQYKHKSISIERANIELDKIIEQIAEITNNIEFPQEISLKNPKAVFSPIEIPLPQQREKVSNKFVLKVFIGVILFGLLYIYYSAKIRPPKFKLEGIICTNDKKPLSAAKVYTTTTNCLSNNDGIFSISLKKKFPLLLSIYKPGYQVKDTILTEIPNKKIRITLKNDKNSGAK